LQDQACALTKSTGLRLFKYKSSLSILLQQPFASSVCKHMYSDGYKSVIIELLKKYLNEIFQILSSKLIIRCCGW